MIWIFLPYEATRRFSWLLLPYLSTSKLPNPRHTLDTLLFALCKRHKKKKKRDRLMNASTCRTMR